jgi:hypothetical protein
MDAASARRLIFVCGNEDHINKVFVRPNSVAAFFTLLYFCHMVASSFLFSPYPIT